uniref:Autophagy-related protein n=1 Tax=Acrobeloides nanus TaxID=290746 RepID=A0A914DN69_9BILA
MRILLKLGSVADNFKDEPLLTPWHTPKCFYGTSNASMSTESLATISPKSSTSSSTSTCSDNSSPTPKISSCSSNFDSNGQRLPYKQRIKFCCRRSEYFTIHQKYSDKIALIVEKFKSEKRLPDLVRCQFVVPRNTTVGQLQHIIRQKIGDNRNMPVYILVANKELPSLTTTMASLHERFHDEDGFLYIAFSSEDSFG